MKYALLMTNVGDAWERLPAPEQARVIERHREAQRTLESEGKFVSSLRLRPPDTARTVRLRADGSLRVTDGPFAEAKEWLGGLYVLECASMDEALEWARRLRFIPGSIEVRPLQE